MTKRALHLAALFVAFQLGFLLSASPLSASPLSASPLSASLLSASPLAQKDGQKIRRVYKNYARKGGWPIKPNDLEKLEILRAHHEKLHLQKRNSPKSAPKFQGITLDEKNPFIVFTFSDLNSPLSAADATEFVEHQSSDKTVQALQEHLASALAPNSQGKNGPAEVIFEGLISCRQNPIKLNLECLFPNFEAEEKIKTQRNLVIAFPRRDKTSSTSSCSGIFDHTGRNAFRCPLPRKRVLKTVHYGPQGDPKTQSKIFFGIRGKVIDAETARPLSGVKVKIEGTVHQTITSADGEYEFTSLPLEAKKGKISASLTHYESAEAPMKTKLYTVLAGNDLSLSPKKTEITIKFDLNDCEKSKITKAGGIELSVPSLKISRQIKSLNQPVTLSFPEHSFTAPEFRLDAKTSKSRETLAVEKLGTNYVIKNVQPKTCVDVTITLALTPCAKNELNNKQITIKNAAAGEIRSFTANGNSLLFKNLTQEDSKKENFTILESPLAKDFELTQTAPNTFQLRENKACIAGQKKTYLLGQEKKPSRSFDFKTGNQTTSSDMDGKFYFRVEPGQTTISEILPEGGKWKTKQGTSTYQTLSVRAGETKEVIFENQLDCSATDRLSIGTGYDDKNNNPSSTGATDKFWTKKVVTDVLFVEPGEDSNSLLKTVDNRNVSLSGCFYLMPGFQRPKLEIMSVADGEGRVLLNGEQIATSFKTNHNFEKPNYDDAKTTVDAQEKFKEGKNLLELSVIEPLDPFGMSATGFVTTNGNHILDSACCAEISGDGQ